MVTRLCKTSADMSVVEIDGLPYVADDWLESRIYRDCVRAKRWLQEARRMERRTDADGLATRAAYLWHALQATYRAEKWHENLMATQAAIVERQRRVRVAFGQLVRYRRLAAGMNLRELGRVAGVDDKTIANIENASFPPSRRVLQSVVAVNELSLTWAEVSPVLLEVNPADGRKNRRRRRR